MESFIIITFGSSVILFGEQNYFMDFILEVELRCLLYSYLTFYVFISNDIPMINLFFFYKLSSATFYTLFNKLW